MDINNKFQSNPLTIIIALGVLMVIYLPFNLNAVVLGEYNTLGAPNTYASGSSTSFGTEGKWVMIDDNFNKSIGFNKVRILNKPTTNSAYCCVFFASSPNYNSNNRETVFNINFWNMFVGDNCNQGVSGKKVSVVGKNVGDNWYEYTFKNTIYFFYYQKNCPRNQIMAFIPTQSYTYDDYSSQQSFAQSGEEYFNLGFQAHQSGNYDQAIIYYNKAISAGYINGGVTYNNLGTAYGRKGDYDQAIIYYNKAISAGDINDGATYNNLGNVYYDKGDYDQAIIYLNKAISAGCINDGEVYNDLGNAYYKKGDYDQAIIYLNKAISAGNINGGATYYNLGTTYIKKYDYDQAIIYLNKAISAGDINGGATYKYLGAAYYYKGDYDQAIIYLNKAISAGFINDGVTYSELGVAYGDKGDYDQAIIYYNKAISAGDTYCYLEMSDLYAYIIDKKDFWKAIDYLNKYLSLSKDENAEYNVLLRKGEIFLTMGNLNDATKVWNTLKQKYPDYANEDESDFAYAMIHKDYSIYEDVDVVSTSTYQNNNNTFAVIIANEDYKEEAKVPNAKADGEAFKNYCQNVFGIPDKNIKYVENATLNTMKHELKWLKDVAEAYKGDASVIFYYAGHGIPDESSKEAYLLPVDGYGSDPTTGYCLTDLYSLLSSLPTKKCVAFLDACFSGSKRDGKMMASSRGVSIKVKSNKPKGNLVVLSAAQGDETAYAYKDKGHGMFTYFILKKLKDSNGDVTLGDLSQYVIDQVSKKSIVENGKSQTPAVLISDNATNWQSWKLK